MRITKALQPLTALLPWKRFYLRIKSPTQARSAVSATNEYSANKNAAHSAALIERDNQIENEEPQPQVVVALGFLITKREPSKPS